MRYKILSVFAAAAAMAACADLTSINSNPNGPQDLDPPSMLASALDAVGSGVDGVDELNVRGAGLWSQYYSEIQYRDEDKYIMRSGTSGGWGFYSGALEDFQRMIAKGQAASHPNWTAVGRIMKSYTFSVMTDAMGDLPYSEALKSDTTLQPVYDTQQAIYNGLFADLTLATTELDAAAAAPPGDPVGIGFATGDLLYNGDMAEWRKLANSLRLRLAIHLTNVDSTKAAAEAAAAVTGGVFTDNADNAIVTYLAVAPNQNPIYEDVHVGGRDDYGMSKTYVDSLMHWSDPRLSVFAQLNRDTDTVAITYRGLPNGLNDGEGPKLFYISRIGALWRETPNAPMPLLTYSEVLFLEAEAAQRGWIPGSAATFYNNAIRASMEFYRIPDAAITAYLADSRVTYVPDSTGLKQIAYQKWVSLFMQGMESWTEVRRTGVPALVPGCRAVMRHIPERLPYDDNESVLNGTNMTAAVTRQGFAASNDIAKPLWFTKRTTSTTYPPPVPCP
ncbi:MAG: hypothetical protein DMD59_08405 [Gemmatimonadetes bacterium]|nr:MAG: hypothetical protein DMD59_08405 [Gemmatimonadota bacterium]